MYIDMHCHCNELSREELEKNLSMNIHLVAVSEDWESTYTILELHEEFKDGVTPCIGIHPWVAHKHSVDDARKIVDLALKNNVRCLGEVGLDKVFVPKTYNKQLELFNVFVEAAREYNLLLNLHTPGTWREVYEILVKNDIGKAYFHWYTGPLTLLREFEAIGYFIGVNPAWKIQGKHRKVIREAPVSIIITESDAPYEYKGLKLSPSMVIDTIKYIAREKGLEEEFVRDKIYSNAKKLLGFS